MAEKREEIELRSQFRIFSFSRLLSVNQSSLQRRRSRINLCFLELFSSLSSRFRWSNQSRKVLIPRKTIVACLSVALFIYTYLWMPPWDKCDSRSKLEPIQVPRLHQVISYKFEGVTKMILNWVFHHECCSPSFKDKKESLGEKGCYSFLPSFEGKFATCDWWGLAEESFPFLGPHNFHF